MEGKSSCIENHPLRTLFCPRSVALIGASDRSNWSLGIFRNFAGYEFDGKLYAVNARGTSAHGLPGFASCRAIGEPVDSAYFFVPLDGMFEALADAAAAGIRSGVILTSGFAETGEEGRKLQLQLATFADTHGMKLLGPNSLGFANFSERSAVSAVMPPGKPLMDGGVALISQSGATIYEIASFAYQENIGLSFMVATGNEAQVNVSDIIDYLIEDPNTRAIAIFAEHIKDTKGFIAAGEKALAAGKPIVIMKVGKSELTGQIAKAHTGSLVGDDRVFDAACQQLGVIRVNSIEDLVFTAGLLAQIGPLKKPGVGVVSISGGACGLIADRAAEENVLLPQFALQTVAELREIISSYGSTINPLDITGAAIRDFSLFEKELTIIGRDPSVGLTLCVYPLPERADESATFNMLPAFAYMGRGLTANDTPGLLLHQCIKPVTVYGRSVMKEAGIPGIAVGIDNTMRALGKITWWSSLLQKKREKSPPAPSGKLLPGNVRPRSEREVLDFLEGFGVPVVPAMVAKTAEEAVTAARQMGGSVALKIASPDIAHKTEIGGVRLGVAGDGPVIQAFQEIDAKARAACPDAQIDGIIVSPMRGGGVELMVGTARDPEWGPVIVVGLGGVWVEVLRDTALRLLPITRNDVVEMLSSLRAAKLLQGFRGAPVVDLDAVADVIVRIGNAALALGPDLVTLECNPLLVIGNKVEALDGLTVWTDATPAEAHRDDQETDSRKQAL